MQVGGRGGLALAARQAEAPPQVQQAPDCDHLGFLVEGGEDDASVHALVQVASENLELKQRLHEMSTELLSLQTIVHRCHLQQEMEHEHQQVEKHKFEWKSRYWNAVEHERFLQAVKMHGHRNFKAIAAYVGSRTPTQVGRPVVSRHHNALPSSSRLFSSSSAPPRPLLLVSAPFQCGIGQVRTRRAVDGRTGAQVKTHAQKYFQKINRQKGSKNAGSKQASPASRLCGDGGEDSADSCKHLDHLDR